MNIITILACLLIDRYYQISADIRQHQLFDKYFGFLQQKWFSVKQMSTASMLALIFIPLIVVTAVIQIVLNHVIWGIPGFIFNLVILFYCLGPTHIREQYDYYFAAKERGDLAGAYASLNTRMPHLFNDANDMTRSMTKHILRISNQNIIAILFWFLLFGATGAIIYRAILQLKDYEEQVDDFYQQVGKLSMQVKQYLDWIPVRILALCFAVAGNFVECFSVFVHYVFASPEENDQLLVKSGLAALGVKENIAPSANEDQEAVNLVDRVLVVFLVVLALMTLASWLS